MRHNLRPLFDRVVVKELEPDRIRQSGLLVPAGTHEPPPQHGIVLAVGPGLDWWEQAGIAMPVKPGDHVVFPASAGAWVEVDEERLLVCRVGELLGGLDAIEDPVPSTLPPSRSPTPSPAPRSTACPTSARTPTGCARSSPIPRRARSWPATRAST